VKYFKNPEDSQVYGYDNTQGDLIAEAISKGWQDVSDSWPPPPDFLSLCKRKAKQLLSESDWSVLSDVTIGTPALTNQADFIAYRTQIRELAVNPVANPIWPTEPTPIWS